MKYLRSLTAKFIILFLLFPLLSPVAQINCDSLDYAVELINPDFDSLSEYGEEVLINTHINFPEWQISSIEWVSDEELACYDCLANYFSPTDTTNVQIKITLEDGCIVSDEITFYVFLKKNVFVPNVFSPNWDGINDACHVFVYKSVEQIQSFKIFSRKGHLVHEAYNFHPYNFYAGWDGTFRGEKLHSETYVWKIVVEYINGEEETLTGTVDLIR